MIASKAAFSLLICACSFGVSIGSAFAQQAAPSSSSAEQAEALFREAVQAMEAGNFAEACPKLEASHKLDPAGGTVLNLGYCLEKLGKHASAHTAYEEALQRAERDGRDDRVANARSRMESLRTRLSYLRLNLVPEVRQLTGLEVTLDGKAISQAELDSKVQVDPGGHRLRVSAPGRLPLERSLDVPEEPTTLEVFVEQLSPPPSTHSETQKASPAPPPKKYALPIATPEQTRSTAPIWIAGASGAVFIAVGSVAGLIAIDRNNEGKPYDTPANVANVGFAAGAIALGVAVYLWLSDSDAPKRASANTELYPVGPAVRF